MDIGGKRRVPVVVAVAAVGVLVVTTGLVLRDRWWRRAGPRNPGTSCPKVVAARHHPPFAAFGVHRVALIGDSIMDQPSCAIAESLAGIGIETFRDAVAGTGLLTGTVDWLAETRTILQTQKPDVVVAIFVGNYYPPPARDAAGAAILVGTPEFFAAWQRRAVALSAEVRAAHVRMYWVSPPPIALPPLGHAPRLYAGYRTIRGDHFLDSGGVLGGANGEEVPAMQTCGRRRVVRSPVDATHLTEDGERIYGQQIAHDLGAQLGVVTAPRPC